VNIALARSEVLPILRQPFLSALGPLAGDAIYALITVLAWFGVALTLLWKHAHVKI
jgi:hypothetical protein